MTMVLRTTCQISRSALQLVLSGAFDGCDPLTPLSLELCEKKKTGDLLLGIIESAAPQNGTATTSHRDSSIIKNHSTALGVRLGNQILPVDECK